MKERRGRKPREHRVCSRLKPLVFTGDTIQVSRVQKAGESFFMLDVMPCVLLCRRCNVHYRYAIQFVSPSPPCHLNILAIGSVPGRVVCMSKQEESRSVQKAVQKRAMVLDEVHRLVLNISSSNFCRHHEERRPCCDKKEPIDGSCATQVA